MRHIPACAGILLLALAIVAGGDAFARGKGGFSSGGGFRSGGGLSRPSAPSYRPTPSHRPAPTPSFRPSPSGRPSSKGFDSTPRAPTTPRISAPTRSEPRAAPATRVPVMDPAAERARTLERSRVDFEKAHAQPRPTIRGSSPTPAQPTTRARTDDRPMGSPIPSGRTTSTRTESRPVVIQRSESNASITDSPWFWWWVLNNDNRRRDEWVYHNRDRLSAEQMEELRRKDSRLEDRLKELENKGVARDPSFRIPEAEEAAQKKMASEKRGTRWLLWFGAFLLLLAAVYLVFVHRFPRRRIA